MPEESWTTGVCTACISILLTVVIITLTSQIDTIWLHYYSCTCLDASIKLVTVVLTCFAASLGFVTFERDI